MKIGLWLGLAVVATAALVAAAQTATPIPLPTIPETGVVPAGIPVAPGRYTVFTIHVQDTASHYIRLLRLDNVSGKMWVCELTHPIDQINWHEITELKP
jgi:hypothetical protein